MMNMASRHKLLILGMSTAIAVPLIAAQQPPSQPQEALPQFEVASIKPNKSGDGRIMMGVQPGGRLNATNVTLKALIRNAYQVQDFQIAGGPDWMTDEHYDVLAKAENDGTGDPARSPGPGQPSKLQLMLRALLADRFKLAVHNETRDMPIYALITAKRDGTLGPQMQKSTVDCAAGGRGRGPLNGPGGPGGPPPAQGQAGPGGCGIRVGPGSMSVGGSPLSQFAASLGMWVGRIVVDKTGLEGNYDFNLTWTPDQMPQRPPGMPEPPPIDPNGPSIFTAVQEQLGLKLDSQRGPVSVLVIDHAEHPVAD
jgi:uncharacterized protein (TIGR03435 family)